MEMLRLRKTDGQLNPVKTLFMYEVGGYAVIDIFTSLPGYHQDFLLTPDDITHIIETLQAFIRESE